jgi:hypothetical protein
MKIGLFLWFSKVFKFWIISPVFVDEAVDTKCAIQIQ